jgi:hypothetical protein
MDSSHHLSGVSFCHFKIGSFGLDLGDTLEGKELFSKYFLWL